MENKFLIFSFVLIFSLSFISATISRDEAIAAINNSQAIMERMQLAGFSVSYINDSLYQANIVLDQAYYADILRNSSSSASEKNTARNMLKLVDWKNIYYDSVLIYTSSISQREQTAYDISDLINVANRRLKNLNSTADYSEAFKILYKANESFVQERFEESQNLLNDVNTKIDEIATENSTLNVITTNAKNFFYRYWWQIIIFLIVFITLALLIFKKVNRYLLVKRIHRTKTELKVLHNLKIQNQTERFKENNVSALVYNIREKNYDSRIARLTELLPVLEKRLRKS